MRMTQTSFSSISFSGNSPTRESLGNFDSDAQIPTLCSLYGGGEKSSKKFPTKVDKPLGNLYNDDTYKGRT